MRARLRARGGRVDRTGRLGRRATAWFVAALVAAMTVAASPGTSAAASAPGAPAQPEPAGRVLAWGGNWSAQLARGTIGFPDPRPGVVPVGKVISVAATLTFNLVIRPDGSVWGWGRGLDGNLGTAVNGDTLRPVPVHGLSGIRSVSPGNPNLALRRDGTVWLWGTNVHGRPFAVTRVPERKRGLPRNVVTVAGGAIHSLALLSDGRVLAWGDNQLGQLGDGTSRARLRPEPVAGLPPIKAISSGGLSSYAVARDGTLWAWGDNGFGELGDGTFQTRRRPVRVAGLTGVTQVVGTTLSHTLALRRDGTVGAWGADFYGQLGTGRRHSVRRPVQTRIAGVTAIAAAQFQSVALRHDGTVWAWGNNGDGQLARPPDGADHTLPVRIRGLYDMRAVSTGGTHTIALR
jgi:alpha-tubulin suppressor-like RCC1 family protein